LYDIPILYLMADQKSRYATRKAGTRPEIGVMIHLLFSIASYAVRKKNERPGVWGAIDALTRGVLVSFLVIFCWRPADELPIPVADWVHLCSETFVKRSPMHPMRLCEEQCDEVLRKGALHWNNTTNRFRSRYSGLYRRSPKPSI
jgi:hypothetical protein